MCVCVCVCVCVVCARTRPYVCDCSESCQKYTLHCVKKRYELDSLIATARFMMIDDDSSLGSDTVIMAHNFVEFYSVA